MVKSVLPQGWQIKKMPDVVKWGSGGTPKATEKSYYENGTIPWLVIGDLNDGIITKSASRITSLGLQSSSAKMVPVGTLLVAMYGSIGKLGITGIECCTNQAIAFARELHGVTTKYMFYFLASQKSCLIAKGKGGTQKNISQAVLKTLNVPVPPLPEQERIVAKIEELFSQLDAVVAELNSVKEKLAVYRQAVLKEAFSSVKDAPEKKAEEVCFFITKGTTPSKMSLLKNGEIPFIKVYNLTFDNRLDFSIDPTFVSRDTHNHFLSRSKVLPGDVLMNIVGPPLGKVSIVPKLYPEWNINQAIARFRCSEKILNSYLAYFLGSAATVERIKKKTKATSGQFNLTLETCRNISIPIPTIDEQLKLVRDIELKLSVCDNIQQTVDSALQRAAALRQSILKQAFEGNL